jgi:hypothetical protein
MYLQVLLQLSDDPYTSEYAGELTRRGSHDNQDSEHMVEIHESSAQHANPPNPNILLPNHPPLAVSLITIHADTAP